MTIWRRGKNYRKEEEKEDEEEKREKENKEKKKRRRTKKRETEHEDVRGTGKYTFLCISFYFTPHSPGHDTYKGK